MKMGQVLTFVGCLLCLFVGCGEKPIDYSAIKLVTVRGQVTLDGSPLPDARVRFVGEDGAGSEATTDSNGKYTLRYDSNRLGATPGKKKVIITTAKEAAGDDPDAKSERERVPAKYNSATELEVEVSNERTVYDFQLATT